MMKNLKVFFIICVATIFSCDEDKIGPLVRDNGIAPGSIDLIDSAVRNFPGGSEITYNLPDDSDLLYVLGEYIRTDNGDVVSVKSSVFNNSLIVEGFAEEAEYEVNLYAVDQSENKSNPVSVTINPERPPYLDVCESVYAEPTYGGLNVFWENPEGGQVIIELYTVDEYGSLIFQNNISSESTFGQGQILNLAAVETDFVFIVKDAFGNQCDRIRFTTTPLYIEIFDRSKFQSIFQPFDQPNAYTGWELNKLFDGSTGNNGFHTVAISESTDTDPVLPYYEGHEIDGAGYRVPLFTIDLGDVYQVYRFRYWPRVSYEWRHGNPKEFDLWGSDTLNADGSLDGWTLLLDKVGPVKPSGTECDNGSTTEEDLAYANAGLSFDISPDMPKVRYIRFAQRLAQNCSTTLLHLSEVEFSGDNR
jgi:hypothetical protein